MKKLLILVLVLGIAASANAYILSGPDQMEPSDVAWIQLIAEATDPVGGLDLFVVITTPATGEWYGGANQYAPPAYAGAPGNVYYGLAMDVDGDTVVDDIWNSNQSEATTTAITPGVVADFEFHCKAIGPAVITLLDGSFGPLGSITIQQVPEPMTIALLGLGGLLLRRRKA